MNNSSGRDILWFQHINDTTSSSKNIDTTILDEVIELDREPTVDDFINDITFIKYNGLVYAKKNNEYRYL